MFSTKNSLRAISQQKKQKQQQSITSNTVNNNDIEMCVDCNNNNMVELNGFMTCKDCGLILGKQIDSNIEWRCSNSTGIDKTRTSINDNKYVKGNTTNTTVGFNVNSKNCKNNNLIKTMSEWKQISYKDSSMINKIQYITNVCKNNDINDKFIDDICEIFYKICNIKNPVRSKLKALMAASVQLCFMEKDMFKCDSEVSQMFDINEKLYNKLFKDFELVWKELKKNERFKNKTLRNMSIDNITSNEYDKFDNPNNVNNFMGCISSNMLLNPDNGTLNITNDTKINDIIVSSANITNFENTTETSKYNNIVETDNNKLIYYLKRCNIDNSYFDLFIKFNKDIIMKKILSNHIPRSRYAVIIYYICQQYNIECNKYNIIKVCRTSEVTFNKCLTKLV
jgi:hypothetical protein